MRIRVIEAKCSGHARCAAVAPEVYMLDDDGYLRMPETDVRPALEAAARRGARACPEQAIALLDDAAGKTSE